MKTLITVSEQGIPDFERTRAGKDPKTLRFTRGWILNAHIRINRDPNFRVFSKAQGWIRHLVNVPMLVAAVHADVDFLATQNTKHFIADAEDSRHRSLRIGGQGSESPRSDPSSFLTKYFSQTQYLSVSPDYGGARSSFLTSGYSPSSLPARIDPFQDRICQTRGKGLCPIFIVGQDQR